MERRDRMGELSPYVLSVTLPLRLRKPGHLSFGHFGHLILGIFIFMYDLQ